MTTQLPPPPLWTLALQAAASLVGDALKTPPTSATKTNGELFHSSDPNIPVHEVLTAIGVVAKLVGKLSLVTAAQPSSVGIPSRSKRMAGQPWTSAQERALITRHQAGIPTRELAIMLQRSDGAIRSRLHLLNGKPERLDDP